MIMSSDEIALQTGDIFIAVTDGIEESSLVEGEMLGREPMFDLIRERREESAQRIADGVIRLASLPFSREHPQDDDFTAVVLKVLSE
jgi:serine phosphatase RsbU (regulator of sigma subunit)